MSSEAVVSREKTGFYCSTSGTYFSDKESLAEHYKSEFHRYNLKRKVAGLPPVTREWFDERKTLLSSVSSAPSQRVWYDPLTRKKFMTENTYLAHVNSKKYQDLVKRSGQAAPAPVVMLKALPEQQPQKAGQRSQEPGSGGGGGVDANGAAARSGAATAGAANGGSKGYTITLPSGGAPRRPAAAEEASSSSSSDDASDAGSDWETASGSDAAELEDGTADWEEWDVCRSLFDNRIAPSLQDNLDYMLKRFGFYLPDAESLVDPEGLLRYLGQKLRYGRVPLYARGDDENAKQFQSLHAVQRHMVDSNQCKLAYDSNEDEYAEFYDYSAAGADEDGADSADAAGSALVAVADAGAGAGAGAAVAAGYELAVGGAGAGKVIGSRGFARYYRQRPRPEQQRTSVLVAQLVARYRSLGVATRAGGGEGTASGPERDGVRRAQRELQRGERARMNLAMRTNVNNNLPKNVPY